MCACPSSNRYNLLLDNICGCPNFPRHGFYCKSMAAAAGVQFILHITSAFSLAIVWKSGTTSMSIKISLFYRLKKSLKRFWKIFSWKGNCCSSPSLPVWLRQFGNAEFWKDIDFSLPKTSIASRRQLKRNLTKQNKINSNFFALTVVCHFVNL